jgi:hypothetical protein
MVGAFIPINELPDDNRPGAARRSAACSRKPGLLGPPLGRVGGEFLAPHVVHTGYSFGPNHPGLERPAQALGCG